MEGAGSAGQGGDGASLKTNSSGCLGLGVVSRRCFNASLVCGPTWMWMWITKKCDMAIVLSLL